MCLRCIGLYLLGHVSVGGLCASLLCLLLCLVLVDVYRVCVWLFTSGVC